MDGASAAKLSPPSVFEMTCHERGRLVKEMTLVGCVLSSYLMISREVISISLSLSA